MEPLEQHLGELLVYHQQLAEVLFQAQQWSALADKQEEIVRRDPRVEMRTRLAIAYSRAKRHDKAREAARAAIEEHRDNALTHYQLGAVEKRAGDFDAAIEKADDAIARDPRFLEAYRLKAECLGAQKKYAEGEKVVDQALTIAPTDFELHSRKGQFVFMQGYQLYEQAFERDSKEFAQKTQSTPLPQDSRNGLHFAIAVDCRLVKIDRVGDILRKLPMRQNHRGDLSVRDFDRLNLFIH